MIISNLNYIEAFEDSEIKGGFDIPITSFAELGTNLGLTLPSSLADLEELIPEELNLDNYGQFFI